MLRKFRRPLQELWTRAKRRPPARRSTRQPFPQGAVRLEQLEARRVLAPIVVTTAVDTLDPLAGVSLRAAIIQANSIPGDDEIQFDSSLDGTPITLALLGAGEDAAATGDLDVTSNITIAGNGARNTIIDGGGIDRVFHVLGNSILRISDVTIRNGAVGVGANGGGVLMGDAGGSPSVTVLRSTIDGNQADRGGGIYAAGGQLVVAQSTISNNASLDSAGGIGTLGATTLTLANSTVSYNSARMSGGGVWANGTTATIVNSTIIRNRADSDGNNTGNGGGLAAGGADTLYNSIVAGNYRGTGTVAYDILESVEIRGNNIIGDAATAGGVSHGVDGNIVGNGGSGVLDLTTVLNTTLANNGGPTDTHALVSGSVAIDAGSNALVPADDFDLDGDSNTAEAVPFDQRGPGFVRVLDGDASGTATVDIGAFEAPLPPPGPETVMLPPAGGNTRVLLDGGDLVVLDKDGNELLRKPPAMITVLTVNGTAGADDTLTIDLTGGSPLPGGGIVFHGGAGGNDALGIRGTGSQTTTYTPSATTHGDGTITIDGRTISFTGLEPLDFDNVGTFNLDLPGADDVVDVSEGFNSAITAGLEPAGSVPALVFSGTSGGVSFETAHVFRTANVIVDTAAVADGSDAVTISSAANAHANTNLTIALGSTGTDTLVVNGEVAVSGSFSVTGLGQVGDSAHLNANITAASITGDAIVVHVDDAPSGQIQDGVDLAASGATVNVAAGTYSELVSVNKPLSLLGAQAGVDARTRAVPPALESIVDGAVVGPDRTTAFYITASGVVVDGFTARDQSHSTQFGAGIVMGGGTSNVTLRNNIIANNAIGVYVNSAGASLIERNLFDGNNTPGPGGASAIYAETSVDLTVDDNEFINHTAALGSPLRFVGADATGTVHHTNLAFTDNYLHTNGSGVFVMTVSGGLFARNTITTGGLGTALTFGEANTNIEILNNDLSGNLRGLRFAEFGFVVGLNPSTNIQAHFNDLSNNTQFGAGITDAGAGDGYDGLLDLTGNWWGDITGPMTVDNPGGSGAALVNDFSDNIDFQPWLVYSPDGDAATPGVQVVNSFSVPAQAAGFTTTNNNYRRLVNVVDLLLDGQTATLSGLFDWTEPNADAAWALGNDGVASAADDYSLSVRNNLNNVTITAASLGDARIQGPGDLAAVNLEGVFVFDGGDNQNWTISNLEIFDFDLAIGMFFGAGGADAFNNTTITNNHIRVPADLNATVAPVDVSQNIGIHYSFGVNQTISNNLIELAGDGVSNSGSSIFAASVAMQSNTSGGTAYNGLVIDNNTIRVLNAQSADPELILGIWENAHGHASNITVSNNQFLNLAGGNDPALNLQRAFRVTSHSSASTTVQYTGNTVTGANIGFQWLASSNFSGNQPVQLRENVLTNNHTGVQVQSQGSATLFRNTITGSGLAGVEVLTGSLAPFGVLAHAVQENFISGGAGDGIRIAGTAGAIGSIHNNDLSGNALAVNNLSAGLIDASGNWYGVNTPAGVAAEVSANVDYTPWLDVGTDTQPGTPGFQGTFAVLHVDDDSPQSGAVGRIQEAIDLTTTGGTVQVASGAYIEDVLINKAGLNLLGAGPGMGPGASTISGPIGGDGATVRVGASNVAVAGFTITREGNNPADWNDPGLNFAGVAVQGQAVTGMTLHDNLIWGNRTGIDVNNSNGHTIRNNVIENNHTGLIFRNQTDNTTFVENTVIDNRTVGILFLDASGGTNVPVQSAINSDVQQQQPQRELVRPDRRPAGRRRAAGAGDDQPQEFQRQLVWDQCAGHHHREQRRTGL
jgi:nitrous oxidase accessory protein NosD